MAFWAVLGGIVKRALANKIGATVGSKALGAVVGEKIGAGSAPTSIGGQIGQGLMDKALGVGDSGGGGMPGGDIPLSNDTNSQRVLTPPAQQQKKYYGIQR